MMTFPSEWLSVPFYGQLNPEHIEISPVSKPNCCKSNFWSTAAAVQHEEAELRALIEPG